MGQDSWLPDKPTPKKEEKILFDDELPHNPTTFDRPSNLPTPRQNLSISQCFSSSASKYDGNKY